MPPLTSRRIAILAGLSILLCLAAVTAPAAADSTVEWRNNDNSDPVTGAAANDSVVFTGDDSTGVLAIDASDGSTVWTNSTADPFRVAVNQQQLVYAEFGTDRIVALDATDGTQNWSLSLSDTSQDVAINDTYVASSNTGNVTLHNRSNGNEIWNHTHHGSTAPTRVAIGDGRIYSYNNSVVVAADASDGSQLWTFTVDTSGAEALTAAPGHNRVYVADKNNDAVVALDASDGTEQWRHTKHTAEINDLTVNGDVVVSGDNSGTVIAYDHQQQVTRLNVDDGSIAESVALTSSQFYGGYDDGTVTAWSGHTDPQLIIRNESAPTELVTESTDVTLETTDGSTVDTRTVSDGTVDLSAFNQELLATVEADGYASRTLLIENPDTDSTIYLLNSSKSTVNIDFNLDDRTGRYPASDTTLYIERSLTRNGTTDYRVVTSASFDATGEVSSTLESGTRYRIRVKNDAGDSRTLGGYSSTVDETAVLEIGQFDFEFDTDNKGYTWDASVEENTTGNDKDKIVWKYSDPEQKTSSLDVKIYEQGNKSNEILNTTYTNLGNASFSQLLSHNNTNKTWIVTINGTRDGNTVYGQKIIGKTQLEPGIPLDPFYKEVFSVMLLFVLAGVFGGVRAEAGAIVVSMAAGALFFMGWLPDDISAAMIVVALFVAVLYRMRSTPRPG